MPESIRYGRDKEHEEAIARAREKVRIERENVQWPEGTPQEVIDEIMATIDKEAEEYKDFLRDSIEDVEKQRQPKLDDSTDASE